MNAPSQAQIAQMIEANEIFRDALCSIIHFVDASSDEIDPRIRRCAVEALARGVR